MKLKFLLFIFVLLAIALIARIATAKQETEPKEKQPNVMWLWDEVAPLDYDKDHADLYRHNPTIPANLEFPVLADAYVFYDYFINEDGIDERPIGSVVYVRMITKPSPVIFEKIIAVLIKESSNALCMPKKMYRVGRCDINELSDNAVQTLMKQTKEEYLKALIPYIKSAVNSPCYYELIYSNTGTVTTDAHERCRAFRRYTIDEKAPFCTEDFELVFSNHCPAK